MDPNTCDLPGWDAQYRLKDVYVVVAFHRVINLPFWRSVLRARVVCSARLRQGFGAQPSLKQRQWQACTQSLKRPASRSFSEGWSGRRESNPHGLLGRQELYH